MCINLHSYEIYWRIDSSHNWRGTGPSPQLGFKRITASIQWLGQLSYAKEKAAHNHNDD